MRCPAPSDCFEDPGVCDPDSGVCSFFEQPDGTACHDGLFYTTSEQCVAGKCVGIADVCMQYSVACTMPHNPCVQSGSCVSKTGDCRFVKTPAGAPCDDGDALTKDDQCDGRGVCKGTVFDPCEDVICQLPADEPCLLDVSCVNGNCVFSKEAELKTCGDNKVCADGQCLPVGNSFFTTVGLGHCVDDNEVEINYYFNDVNHEDQCSTACLNDPLCIGYSFMPFTGRTCFVYAPARTRSALNFWTWRGGRIGTDIKTTKSLGAVEQTCYKRSIRVPDAPASFGADAYLNSSMGVVLLIIVLSVTWLLYIKVFYSQVNGFVARTAATVKAYFSKKAD